MRRDPLQAISLVLALLGGMSVAAAQQPPPAADAQQREQQEKAQQTPSGKTGTEEPSAHAPAAKPQSNAVLVNGALAVPGAPENSDTVPAKFSEKNAADDKLIILAYTFKLLTDEQSRAVFEALKDRPAGAAFNADVGAKLPTSVELKAVPDEVTRRVPQTNGYRYAVADNRVLLVSPMTRIVVGVFADAKGAEAGQGRRTP
jgi:glucose/arabinose dehydrogenase